MGIEDVGVVGYNRGMEVKKLFLATDHAGFEHKNALRDYVNEHDSHGYQVVDLGAFQYDAQDDYPQWIARAARAVQEHPGSRAVVFGGSGQGEAIVANKFRGVRAVVYYGSREEMIELSREHNKANVLSIGARFVEVDHMIEVVQKWLIVPFSGEERHLRRLTLIEKIERRRFWQRFVDLVRGK